MAYVIAEPCIGTKDTACVDACPVDCIHPKKDDPRYADSELLYIDPVECIDCGACVPECPFSAIFPEDEVPSAYKARGGEYQSMPVGTAGFTTAYEGSNHEGEPVHLEATRVLTAGQVVDLTPDIAPNGDYYKEGPGYSAA